MPDAFDPSREITPTPGFAQRIGELQRAGRYRTAIEEIFRILDRDPGNQQALSLAADILSMSRTEQLTSVEPLSDTYTFDRRLNPVWAICQKCGRGWVPNFLHRGSIFGGRKLFIMNPLGQQCPKCGYTLCHQCLKRTPTGPGYAVYEQECPHGCGVKLSTPVHPTGRKNLQFGRRPEGLTHVFVFREGPIKPDAEYLRTFLQTRSPDVFKSQPKVFAIAVGRWLEDGFDAYIIASLMAHGITGEMMEHTETGTITDDNGSQVHIVKIYAAR